MGGLIRGYTRHLTPVSPAAARTDPLGRGLVGEWRFNPNTGLTLPDYSGRGNHGTIDGADWIVSERGPGLRFVTANTDFVDTGAERIGGTGLFCAAGEGFTLETTFRVPNAETGTIVGRGGALVANRTFHIYFSGGATPSFILRGTVTSPAPGLNDGTLHSVWVTWDGVTSKLYIDGEFSQNLNVGAAAEEVGQRIIFGARTNGTGWYLDGDIFNVRIWDRALSAAEIRARYQICLKRGQPLTHVWMMPWGKAPIAVRIPRHGFTNFQVPGIV